MEYIHLPVCHPFLFPSAYHQFVCLHPAVSAKLTYKNGSCSPHRSLAVSTKHSICKQSSQARVGCAPFATLIDGNLIGCSFGKGWTLDASRVGKRAQLKRSRHVQTGKQLLGFARPVNSTGSPLDEDGEWGWGGGVC